MDILSLKTLLLLLSNSAAVSAICLLMGVSECNKYHIVGAFKFHAFISRAQFAEACTDFDTVLNCIYLPKYMADCSIDDTFFYDMQRNVAQTVCHDGVYQKHIECLGNADLGQRVSDNCVTLLNEGDVDCNTLMNTRTCISSMILDRCGTADSEYIDVLAYQFLKPYATKEFCTLAEPKLSVFNKTTTENPDGRAVTVTARTMTPDATTTSGRTTSTKPRTTTAKTTSTTDSGASHNTSTKAAGFFVGVLLLAKLAFL